MAVCYILNWTLRISLYYKDVTRSHHVLADRSHAYNSLTSLPQRTGGPSKVLIVLTITTLPLVSRLLQVSLQVSPHPIFHKGTRFKFQMLLFPPLRVFIHSYVLG